MLKKVISVSQMATVLGISLTAVREGIAGSGNSRLPTPGSHLGKRSRAFCHDKEGFKTYLMHSLGWDLKIIDAEFKAARIQ